MCVFSKCLNFKPWVSGRHPSAVFLIMSRCNNPGYIYSYQLPSQPTDKLNSRKTSNPTFLCPQKTTNKKHPRTREHTTTPKQQPVAVHATKPQYSLSVLRRDVLFPRNGVGGGRSE